jgi:hypothetical protein
MTKQKTQIETPIVPEGWNLGDDWTLDIEDPGWKFLRDSLDKSGEGLTMEITVDVFHNGQKVGTLKRTVSPDKIDEESE